MRVSILPICAALLALAAAPPASACSCIQPGPPEVEMESSDAVFVGQVLAVEAAPQEGELKSFLVWNQVTFLLERVWKGLPEAETAVVRTAAESAACGYEFEVGETYLVYAYAAEEGGELTTNLCTRNAPRERAGEDLAALGEPLWTAPPAEGG